jgi:CBS domain-containing protein
VFECAVKLTQLKIGALVVLQEDKLIGIVSERDILRRVVSKGDDANQTLVEQIMTKALVTVAPSTTVREAMHIVTEKRIRHLPVLENEKLVGLISIGDLTRWAMILQEQQIASLTNYIQG